MKNMLKISEACTLALHAMVIMTLTPETKMTTKELAAVLEASADHLTKVLHRLALAEMIQSTRGPKGGSKLNHPAHTIRLLDIVETIEGPYQPSGCLLQYPICDGKHCIFGSLLKDVNNLVYNYLNKTTLDKINLPEYLVKGLLNKAQAG